MRKIINILIVIMLLSAVTPAYSLRVPVEAGTRERIKKVIGNSHSAMLEIEQRVPELKKFLYNLELFSKRLYMDFEKSEMPKLNEILGGDIDSWQKIFSVGGKIPAVKDQWMFYSNLYIKFSGLNIDKELLFEIMDASAEKEPEDIYDFVILEVPKLIRYTRCSRERFLKSIRGEPLFFGGFEVNPSPAALPDPVPVENKKLWEDKGVLAMRLGYAVPEAYDRIEVLLKKLEKENKLGDLILDIGSGPNPFRIPFYKDRNKAIIGIDFSIKEDSVYPDSVIAPAIIIKGDAHDIDNVLLKPEVYSFMAKAYGSSKAAFTSIVFLDVLNYLDYRYVLKRAMYYLQPGGRIIISNMAGVGLEKLFNKEKGVKSNIELLNFIKELGFELEIEENPEEDTESDSGTGDRQIIVARKKADIFEDALKNKAVYLKGRFYDGLIPDNYRLLENTRKKILSGLTMTGQGILSVLMKHALWVSDSTPVDVLDAAVTRPVGDWEAMDQTRSLFIRLDKETGVQIKGTGRQAGSSDRRFTADDMPESDSIIFIPSNETTQSNNYIWYGETRFRAQIELWYQLGLQTISYVTREKKSKAIASVLGMVEPLEIVSDNKVIPIEKFLMQMEQRAKAILSIDEEERIAQLNGLSEREFFRNVLIGHIIGAHKKVDMNDAMPSAILNFLKRKSDIDLVKEYIKEVGIVQLFTECPTYIRASHLTELQLKEMLREKVSPDSPYSYSTFVKEKMVLDNLLKELYNVFKKDYIVPDVPYTGYEKYTMFSEDITEGRVRHIDIYSYLALAYSANELNAEQILEEIAAIQGEGFSIVHGSGSYGLELFELRNQIAGCILTDSDADKERVAGAPRYKWDQGLYENSVAGSLKKQRDARNIMYMFFTGDRDIASADFLKKMDEIFWKNVSEWFSDIKIKIIDNIELEFQADLKGFKEWLSLAAENRINMNTIAKPFLDIIKFYYNSQINGKYMNRNYNL